MNGKGKMKGVEGFELTPSKRSEVMYGKESHDQDETFFVRQQGEPSSIIFSAE